MKLNKIMYKNINKIIMGGEINKSNLHKKAKEMNDGIVSTSSKISLMTSENTPSPDKVKIKSKSQYKTCHKPKENSLRKKKEKCVIVAKNKKHQNQEKKVLELIHNNNPNKEDYDLMYKIIDNHFFLQTLNEQARNEIIITMSLCKVKKGETLFTQGSVGNYWYIVHSGELASYEDKKFICLYREGESFGEYALMNDAPRKNTVISKTDCQLWVLKRQVFRKILDYLFTLNFNENKKFLDSINLPLDSSTKSFMANNLIQEIYQPDTYICREGEIGNCMYIIKEGEVECRKGDKVIRTLQKGDNFGQKAILEETRRSLDVKTKTKCKIYSISQEFFKNQLGPDYKEQLYFSFLSMAFSNSKIFNTINSKMISKTFNLFEIKSFKEGEIIYERGANMKNKLCVVLEGNIVDKNTNKVEAKRYEILFEDLLSQGTLETARNNLLADPDCVLAEADYEEFCKMLGGNIKIAENISLQMNNFENVRIFKNLSEDKIEIIQKNLKIEKFDNGKKIIVQGDIGNKFYIIKSGRVDFFVNSKYIRSLNEGEDFGSRSLILNSDKRTATAIANGEVTCFTLTANVFKSILEENLKNYLKNQFYLEDNSIELKDLDNIKELGSGNFGFVNLVKNRKNKQYYAIKALNLMQIKKEKLETCVELEKNVLLKIDHPFIMKMVKYLKNENFIFFITEYIKGKELWEVIRDIGLLNKEQTQFYGASILLAIEYLHRQKIIYRDIKPENIMVNIQGYIKIIDFGTVKEIKDRTSTIIGTSHYMAPEIVKGEGYSFQVDIWSIAICMYEFFCGKLPFGEELEDPMDIYKAVSKDELVFPKFVHDEEFIDLMNKMLKKAPTNRLWKFQQIKESPYFKNFEWNKLISLSYPPPYNIHFKETADNTKPMPYLSYLQTKEVKRGKKREASDRQIRFEKWFNNF